MNLWYPVHPVKASNVCRHCTLWTLTNASCIHFTHNTSDNENDWPWGQELLVSPSPPVNHRIPAKYKRQSKQDTLCFFNWNFKNIQTSGAAGHLDLEETDEMQSTVMILWKTAAEMQSCQPVCLVAPLHPVALGCLCRLQLPLTLSVQESQCFPLHPEM